MDMTYWVIIFPKGRTFDKNEITHFYIYRYIYEKHSNSFKKKNKYKNHLIKEIISLKISILTYEINPILSNIIPSSLYMKIPLNISDS